MSKINVNFTTKNGNKSIEALGKEAKTYFEKADNMLLNGAYICAHLNGVNLPTWTEVVVSKDGSEETITHEAIEGHKEGAKGKGLSYATIASMVGKSKATVNNYINAICVAIDNDLFEKLANGTIPFNVQKLRRIAEKKDILIDNLHTFEDLMSYSEDSIEDMIKRKEGGSTSGSNANTNTKGEGEGEGAEDIKTIETALSVDGKLYKGELPKSVLDDILEKYFTEVINETADNKA